jgi:hypothetical protein
MKRLTVLVVTMATWLTTLSGARAQWGWPPPGYSVTGVRACDGYHYRGLCEVLRDRRCRSRYYGQSPEPASAIPTSTGMPSLVPSPSDGSALPAPTPVTK